MPSSQKPIKDLQHLKQAFLHGLLPWIVYLIGFHDFLMTFHSFFDDFFHDYPHRFFKIVPLRAFQLDLMFQGSTLSVDEQFHPNSMWGQKFQVLRVAAMNFEFLCLNAGWTRWPGWKKLAILSLSVECGANFYPPPPKEVIDNILGSWCFAAGFLNHESWTVSWKN